MYVVGAYLFDIVDYFMTVWSLIQIDNDVPFPKLSLVVILGGLALLLFGLKSVTGSSGGCCPKRYFDNCPNMADTDTNDSHIKVYFWLDCFYDVFVAVGTIIASVELNSFQVSYLISVATSLLALAGKIFGYPMLEEVASRIDEAQKVFELEETIFD